MVPAYCCKTAKEASNRLFTMENIGRETADNHTEKWNQARKTQERSDETPNLAVN